MVEIGSLVGVGHRLGPELGHGDGDAVVADIH